MILKGDMLNILLFCYYINMNELLLKFIKSNFNKPGSALDLGCGAGDDINNLKHLGWDTEGVNLPEVDLNFFYKSKKKFDLIYSNYVLQFIKNKDEFLKTCYNNLKKGGYLFISTFDKSDKVLKNTFEKQDLFDIFNKYFINIKIEKTKIKDNHEPIGSHNHIVLVLTARK